MTSTYLAAGMMTDPGKQAGRLDGLPGDPAGVARVVQGLMIHEFWADSYGVTLGPVPRATVNLRRVEDLLAEMDRRPLTETREPADRVPTNCRGFTVLAVTMLRAAGVPARARCGFGAYFRAGLLEDHWAVEYRDGGTWKLLDAQIDGLQREALGITFDLADVPRDEFVTADDAWRRMRAGEIDPATCGLSGIGEGGRWWIAGNLVRDAAAVRGVEVLPWDVWPPMPEPEDPVDVPLFDRLAEDPGVLPLPGEVRNLQKGTTDRLT